MENELGFNVTYTTLGFNSSGEEKFIIYTNYLPSDNELGVRLFASRIVCESPWELEKLTDAKQKELIEDFKAEVISSGKKIRRVISR